MWKQPWGYKEGWTICCAIFSLGIVLQFALGSIMPERFRFPTNLIVGALFLLCLVLFHLVSRNATSLQWFSGLTASITSLSSLLFLIIIMGFTAPFTTSWPFILLFFYLLWILGLVIQRRISNFQWSSCGFILNHAGLFIALFAAILGSSDRLQMHITVPINEKIEHPFTMELKSFFIDEYPPKLMLVDNTNGKALPKRKPRSVSVETFPAVAKLLDWELEILNYLPSAAVMTQRDTVHCIPFYSEGDTSALYVKAHHLKDHTEKEGWISCGSYLYPSATLWLNEALSLVMPKREPKRFTSDVTVYSQNGEAIEAFVEVNRPLSVDGWKIYQVSYDIPKGRWSRYSVFELIKDPWLDIVYVGIGMLMVGSLHLLISLLLKKRSI